MRNDAEMVGAILVVMALLFISFSVTAEITLQERNINYKTKINQNETESSRAF